MGPNHQLPLSQRSASTTQPVYIARCDPHPVCEPAHTPATPFPSAVMPKHCPKAPISQTSSFSCVPQPSEPRHISDPQHPATPHQDQGPSVLKPTELLQGPLSVPAFFASINSFLESSYYHEQSLVLTDVSPSRLVRFQRWGLKRKKHLRYAYDAPLRTITIRGMITAVHGALNAWVSRVYAGLHTILSADEFSNLDLLAEFDVRLRGGIVRQPDAAFLTSLGGTGRRDPFPKVVFEAAFKQRYEDAIEGARIWLTKSGGEIKVVVLVNIVEGTLFSGASEVMSEIGQDQELEEEGEEQRSCGSGGSGEGDSAAESGTEEATDSERFSSPPRFKEFHATCNISEWVGPLTATIELFRLSGTEMVRDGPKHNILPRTSEADPVLQISDLVTGGAADDYRVVPLPLESYREALDKAVRDLALARKAAGHTARKRARGEEGINGEEYVIIDEVQEEEEGEGRDVKRVRILRSGAKDAGK